MAFVNRHIDFNTFLLLFIAVSMWYDNVIIKDIGISIRIVEVFGCIIIYSSLIYNMKCKHNIYLKNIIDPISILLLLFFIVSILSTLANRTYSVSARAIIELTIVIILYFSIGSAVIDSWKFIRTYKFLVYGAIIANVLFIYGYFTGLSWLTGKGALYGDLIRTTGTFSDDPNYASLYILITIPLIYGLSLYTNNIIEKLACYIGVIFGVLSTLLTYSRAGILILIATLLFYFYKAFKLKYVLYFLFAILILYVVIPNVYFNYMEYYRGRIETLSQLSSLSMGRIEDQSLAHRFSLIGAGLHMFFDNMFTGVGPGNFQIFSRRYGALGFDAAHNTFLSIAGETGIIGICIFLPIVILTIYNYNSAIKNCVNEKQVLLIRSLKYATLLFLLSALFLTATYTKVFYLLIALSVVLKNVYNKFSEIPVNIQIT